MVYYSLNLYFTFCCNRNFVLVVGEQEGTGATRNTTLEVSGCSFLLGGGLCQAGKEGCRPAKSDYWKTPK